VSVKITTLLMRIIILISYYCVRGDESIFQEIGIKLVLKREGERWKDILVNIARLSVQNRENLVIKALHSVLQY